MLRAARLSKIGLSSTCALGASLLVGCVTTAELPKVPNAGRDPARLLIVDCLLPPQLIGFGTDVRLGSPRPIKTFASDCAIRGGSYVLYDRADYRTALDVWLAAARDGDPEAQTYVGEIYEKGMGTAPDYAEARRWYTMAAEQGLARAKINLGYLYEAGLGVEKNLPTALAWYRDAADLVDGDLEYVSTVELARRDAARTRHERTAEELARTRAALESAQARLSEQRLSVERYAAELARLRDSTSSMRRELLRSAPETDAETSVDGALLRTLERRESELERARAERRALAERLADETLETMRLRERLETSDEGRVESDAERAAASSRIEALNDSLSVAERERRDLLARLEAKDAAVEALGREHERELDAYRRRLADVAALAEDDRRRAAETLLARERELAQRDRRLRELGDELAERERDLGELAPPPPAIAADDVGEVPAPELAVTLLDLELRVLRGGWTAVLPHPDHREIRGRVTPPDNIAALKINGRDRPWKPTGEFDHDRSDDRTMDIVAEGKRGDRLVQHLSFLSPQAPGDGPESPAEPPASADANVDDIDFGSYHALVIGNRQYRHHAPVPSAASDARRVRDVLERHYGFDTTLMIDADHARMLSGIVDFTGALGETDNAVIFYAGHCRREEDGTAAYWLPVDAGDHASDRHLSAASLSAIVESSEARHLLVIADACFSNTLTPASVPRSVQARRDGDLSEFYRHMLADRARVVLTSGATQPLVDDTRQSVQSVFTRALVETLRRNRSVLEASELYRALLAPLARAAERLQRSVDPHYAPIRHTGHAARDFLFVPVDPAPRRTARSRSVSAT